VFTPCDQDQVCVRNLGQPARGRFTDAA
jgi:hypothetical protein